MKTTTNATQRNLIATIILSLTMLIAIPTYGLAQHSTNGEYQKTLAIIRTTMRKMNAVPEKIAINFTVNMPLMEETMDLENWMVDETYWAEKSIIENEMHSALYETKDSEVNLEDWMLEAFSVKSEKTIKIDLCDLLTPEKEPKMEIEAWMADTARWSVK